VALLSADSLMPSAFFAIKLRSAKPNKNSIHAVTEEKVTKIFHTKNASAKAENSYWHASSVHIN